MTEELQALLERINEDGVNKAQAESEKIITESKKNAEQIEKQAQENAEKIKKDANQEADLLLRKGEDSLRQASRDIILSLREQLQERMAAVVKNCLASDTDPKAFAGVIVDTVGKQIGEGTISNLEVEIPEKDNKAITDHILGNLGNDLQKNTEITPRKEIESGFRLRFDNQDVVYDFSDQALADVILGFLGPKLAEIISSSPDKDSSEKSDKGKKEEKQASNSKKSEKSDSKKSDKDKKDN